MQRRRAADTTTADTTTADTTTADASGRHVLRRRGLAAVAAVVVGLVVALSGWTALAAQPTGPGTEDTAPPTTDTPPSSTLATAPPSSPPTTTAAMVPAGRTITATGTGQVEAAPDVVTVRIGTETRAGTVAEALDQSNQRTNAVLDALRGRGVEDRDLQTSELSLWPDYDDEGRTVTGYQARNVVTARLRDVDGAGATIDAAVQAAGDAARLDGVTFSIADDAALLAQARRLAVKDAQDKAGQLADAAGVRLGTLISISESSAGGPGVPMMAGDRASSAVPLAGGTLQLRVDVVVAHAIG